jgi:hypothetical protein
MGQEVEHQSGIDVFEAKLGGSSAKTFAGENEQQPEGVRVSLARMGAIAPLDRHVFAQEGGNQRSDRGHWAFPRSISTSAAVAISVINSGVASRYQ